MPVTQGARFPLPPRRTGHKATDNLIRRRKEYLELLAHVPEVENVSREDVTVAGVKCLSFTPPGADITLLYFHGGAYRAGSPEIFAPFSSCLANDIAARIVSPCYALAPEAPFPAALHDARAVYCELVLNSPGGVFLIGDSAGGGLVLSLALSLIGDIAHNLSARGLVLISPWLDLSVSGESYQTRATTDLRFTKATATEAADQYLQGFSPLSPLTSPVFADHAGLPPVLLLVGNNEVVLDENIALASSLARANVALEFHVVPNVQHVWPVLEPGTNEAQQAVRIIKRFVAHNRTEDKNSS